MIMAFIFNSILAIWLGWYQYLVILSTVILIFWLAQLRLLKIAQRPIGTLEKIIETHLLMDKAIDEQLQVISFDINQSAVLLTNLMSNLSSDAQSVINFISNAKVNDDVQADERFYYQALLEDISQNNSKLLQDIFEVLGVIQYEDVIHQRIKRTQQMIQQRNALWHQVVSQIVSEEAETLTTKFNAILADYLTKESYHNNSLQSQENVGALSPKFELF